MVVPIENLHRLKYETVMKELMNKCDRRLFRILARTSRVLKHAGPIVSFTFDDIPVTASQGAGLLEAANARGAFYISGGLLGKPGPTGRYADRQEVLELHNRGHEIGCHTYSHTRAATSSKSDFAEQLDRNREFLAGITGGMPKSFAFPFGSVSTSAKYVARARYSSCRTTRQFFQTSVFDSAGLGAYPVYSNPEKLRICHEAIDKVAGQSSWLIFYTHDVKREPSAFGCQPWQLQHLIQRCQENCYIFATVVEVIERFSDPFQSSVNFFRSKRCSEVTFQS